MILPLNPRQMKQCSCCVIYLARENFINSKNIALMSTHKDTE